MNIVITRIIGMVSIIHLVRLPILIICLLLPRVSVGWAKAGINKISSFILSITKHGINACYAVSN